MSFTFKYLLLLVTNLFSQEVYPNTSKNFIFEGFWVQAIKNVGSFTNSVRFNFHFVVVATILDPYASEARYISYFEQHKIILTALDNFYTDNIWNFEIRTNSDKFRMILRHLNTQTR